MGWIMLWIMAIETRPLTAPKPAQPKRNRGWLALLLLPYLGLLFPGMYARATPALLGFPFFYWYQFVWVILASALMFVVYRKVKY
jgi:hypothetical protein